MLNELLKRYWDAAYNEGKEGREHDTEDGIAQRTLSEIYAEVRRLIESGQISTTHTDKELSMQEQKSGFPCVCGAVNFADSADKCRAEGYGICASQHMREFFIDKDTPAYIDTPKLGGVSDEH